MAVITVERNILEKNDQVAAQNRDQFKSLNIATFNLLSSPGSGKTTLLEKLLPDLKALHPAVIEGDLHTNRDADRIDALGVPVIQIVTKGGCHLDAMLIRNALQQMDLTTRQLLFIENVGNLVCPASYDLGEYKKVVIISTTEGDDKPIKYNTMFSKANLCIINKTDLLPYVEFDVEKAKQFAWQVNPELEFITASAKTGEGLEQIVSWLKQQVNQFTAGKN